MKILALEKAVPDVPAEGFDRFLLEEAGRAWSLLDSLPGFARLFEPAL